MINYLFSQVRKDIGFSEIQKEFLYKNIQRGMNITFLSSVPNNYERTDEQVDRYIKAFSVIGLLFSTVSSIDFRNTKEEAKTIIHQSDIVFLLGGSPELQMQFIHEYELMDVLQSCKIIIGVSAGAMNQGDRVIYLDEFEHYSLKDYKGLGYTNIHILPHYDIDNQECMNEVMAVSIIHPVTCLPNESFIYIHNGNVEVVGDYFLYDNQIIK